MGEQQIPVPSWMKKTISESVMDLNVKTFSQKSKNPDDLRTFVYYVPDGSDKFRLEEVRNGTAPSSPKIGGYSTPDEIYNIVRNGNNVIIKGRV